MADHGASTSAAGGQRPANARPPATTKRAAAAAAADADAPDGRASSAELLLWLLKRGPYALLQLVTRGVRALLLGALRALPAAARLALLSAPRGLAALAQRVAAALLRALSGLLRVQLALRGDRQPSERGWPAAAGALHAAVTLFGGALRCARARRALPAAHSTRACGCGPRVEAC